MSNPLRKFLTALMVMGATAALGHGTAHPGLDTLDVSEPAQVIEITGQPTPGLEVDVRRAADGGWNFAVALVNFRVMEGDAPADTPGNAGHVHLFVDGEFSARIDGPVGHVDPLDRDVHEIAIGLVTHDDRFIARAGQLVLERFVVLEPRTEPDGMRRRPSSIFRSSPVAKPKPPGSSRAML